MKTLVDIDNTIDALKDVSSNALSKHGYSRSRLRMKQLSVNLAQAWDMYKIKHGHTYRTDLCLFVIKNSASGLKFPSIKKRTGFNQSEVKACLDWLINKNIIKRKIKDGFAIYSYNKK